MLRLRRNAAFAMAVLAAASASGREVCQERVLNLRYAPQAGSNWCWAASSQMVMELLGVEQLVDLFRRTELSSASGTR